MASTDAPRTNTVSPGDLFDDEPERYAVESQIGAGGMGTVVAAKGSRLGRGVALKVVTVDREDLRRRFEREAQVTARLQHPAIVPVYGAGRRDGHPFYAMKHVTGEPLDKVIGKTTTLDERIALLPKVIAVTEAIAYAHAEKVIHRDLKPANILVGGFGETVVIDWGLAKDLARTDDDVESTSPYRASADETAHGKVMGTPAYMPVEQARGEVVDERADVYALGAILYHVLAGAPPYRKADEGSVPWESMLARVISGPPEPLPDEVPADLLAIVNRAMAREPDKRYPSAGELADDLRRFQTGQLVGAHRYSTWQLVERWLRRHRTPVIVAAIALVVLAGGGIFSVREIVAERDTANEQRRIAEDRRAEAEKRKTEAETRSTAAEKLIEFMVFTLRDRLVPVGRLDVLQGVGDAVVTYFDSVAHVSTDESAQTLARRADALDILVDVESAKGNLDATERTAKASMALRDRALALAPDAYDTRFALSGNHMQLGSIAQTRGKLDEAVQHFHDALAIREKLVEHDPTNVAWRLQLARAHGYLGNAEMLRGHLDESLARHREAMKLREAVVAADPANAMARSDLSTSHLRIAIVLRQQTKGDAALAEYQACLDLRSKLAADEPDNVNWQTGLAEVHKEMGAFQTSLAKHDDAIAQYQQSRDIWDKLVARDPANLGWLAASADASTSVADAELMLYRFKEALAGYRAGLDIRRKLAAKDPANSNWRFVLQDSLVKIAYVQYWNNEAEQALATLLEAKPILVELVTSDPKNVPRASGLGVLYERLGSVFDKLGRLDDAIAAYRDERETFDKIVALQPDSVYMKSNLSYAFQNLAEVETEAKRWPEAVEAAQACLALRDKVAAADPKNLRVQRDLAFAHRELGFVRNNQGQLADAAVAFRKALAMFDDLVRANPGNVQLEVDQEVSERMLAETVLASDPAEARALAQRGLDTLDRLHKAGSLDAQTATHDVALLRAVLAKTPK